MSYDAEQRARHQQKSEEALRAGRYSEAAFHTAKTAEYSLLLAEKSDAPLKRAFLTDANELIGLAEKMKQRASQGPDKTGKASDRVARKTEDGQAEDGSIWQLTARPDVKLDDVVGLDDVKKALRENVIWPRQHPELFEKFKIKPQAGVLMYGPPGNGKTHIAKAIAGELDAAFFAVDAAAIKSKWVGESERNVHKLFEAASRHERAIIFIDECESVLASHANEKVNVYNQFLTEIDGIASKGGLFSRFILAATNKPWLLGDAILRPGRLGDHVYVGLPDAAAREGILRYALAGKPIEGELPLAEMAETLEGHSAVEISLACNAAGLRVVTRNIESGNHDQKITLADLREALSEMPRSVSPDQIAKFQTWSEERKANA
jgi:SpoVK/Ycf46/Vps4 family AAA+-type ATPase